MKRINNDWEFTFSWTDGFENGEGSGETVRLPHTVREVPLHYADSSAYETVSGYRRKVSIPESASEGRVFLQFDGAAHIATVFVNGQELATHRCGYTAFRVEITDFVTAGDSALVAVKLDSTENPQIPPFGNVVDYLTYGGLYRDVWLDVRPKKMISDVYVVTPELDRASVRCEADLANGDFLRYEILGPEGDVLTRLDGAPDELCAELRVRDAKSWSVEEPNLYTLRVTLMSGEREGDSVSVTFGFRTAEFTADAFYLNGKKLFLRGLNRHQSYPYIGYAAPEALQREDARILRHELQLNTVRTSHYPQSQYFIDECDRQGLLVFTEIPGWQHVGDAAWKEQACENVREMVMQYRNHPSVILWGVRINESLDDDEFYTRTNAIAHELDPTRATTGVRYFEKSSLLEDVYSFNDFSHNGQNRGAKPKKDVCPDPTKPLLISECNGHKYPTKPSDTWAMRQEHALRHARVLNSAASDGGHVGFYAWCMFDYPTHKDFGSGDRICYHGVMDAFRNPKLAASFYAAQGEESPVLEVTSSMDIGDYPGGQLGVFYILTNADEVAMYKNGYLVSVLRPAGWRGLAHGPIAVRDTIGRLLETQEGFEGEKADVLHRLLLSAKEHGFEGMPLTDKLKMLRCMKKYGLTFEDGYALYGKYVANWGARATQWRFEAIRNGEVVATVTKSPSAKLHLELIPSHSALTEGEVYDMASVRVRLADEYGNCVPYALMPVKFELSGAAELVGPETVVSEGGCCGTYVRTIGSAGKARLTVSAPGLEPVVTEFEISENIAPPVK